MRRIRSTSTPASLLAAFAAGVAPAAVLAQETNPPLPECPPSNLSRVVVSLSGVVRDRDSEAALPGAWVVLEYRSEGSPLEGVEVRSDGDGRYLFCNLTAFTEASVQPTYRGSPGRETRVTLDRSQEIDLEVDLGDAAYLVFSVVSLETGAPVQGASVQLSPIRLGGVTDTLGRVALPLVPPGPYDLEVRHIAYAGQDHALAVEEGQLAEMRVDLATRVVEVEPIQVTITGRDPVLLETGFYDRRETIEDGYFADHEEVEPYIMFRTLFQFNRDLSIRYRRNRVFFVNGRAASRLGYDSVRELNEIPFTRVRGVEVFPCTDAPARLWNQIPMHEVPVRGECNLVLIWTR
jgi:PAS domain-containing protein